MKSNVVPVPCTEIGAGKTIEKPVNIEVIMDFLDCKRTYVYDLMQKGIIPSHKVGGLRKFYLSEVNEAIRAM